MAWTCTRASADHRSGMGLRAIERAILMPSALPTMYVLDERWYPRNTASTHLVPMLPSGSWAGPFTGSL